MRIKIISMLTGLVMAVFMVTATANNGVQITANHQVVSSIADGYGLNAITIEITLNNQSPTDLNSLRLELMEEEDLMLFDTPDILIDNLVSGTSSTVSWTVNSPLSADMLSNLTLTGDALDSSGQTHAIDIWSTQ